MNLTVLPRPLRLTVAVVALQVIALIALAIWQLINLESHRVAMGVTSAAFFLLVAAALSACLWGLTRLNSIARSPIVLAELINLGLAWSFRETPQVGIPLLLASLLALIGIFAPASLHALEPAPEQ